MPLRQLDSKVNDIGSGPNRVKAWASTGWPVGTIFYSTRQANKYREAFEYTVVTDPTDATRISDELTRNARDKALRQAKKDFAAKEAYAQWSAELDVNDDRLLWAEATILAKNQLIERKRGQNKGAGSVATDHKAAKEATAVADEAYSKAFGKNGVIRAIEKESYVRPVKKRRIETPEPSSEEDEEEDTEEEDTEEDDTEEEDSPGPDEDEEDEEDEETRARVKRSREKARAKAQADQEAEEDEETRARAKRSREKARAKAQADQEAEDAAEEQRSNIQAREDRAALDAQTKSA